MVVGAFLGASPDVHAATVRLDELPLATMTAGWGKPQSNLSITQKPLAIGGKKFEHGVGTHAESYVTIQLDGKATSFSTKVGVDDGASNALASVEFIISGNDRELWRSGICKWGDGSRFGNVVGPVSLKEFFSPPLMTMAVTAGAVAPLGEIILALSKVARLPVNLKYGCSGCMTCVCARKIASMRHRNLPPWPSVLVQVSILKT